VVRVPGYRSDIYCFLWGTKWIYICYVEESRPPLWSSGQSSWLQNGDILCFLWGTKWIYICYVEESRPSLWPSDQSYWLQIQRPWFDSRRYQIFWEVVDLELGSLSLVSTTEELLGRNSSGSDLKSQEYGRRRSVTLTRWHPLSAKFGTNSADMRRSLLRYSSLADWSHGVILLLVGKPWRFLSLQPLVSWYSGELCSLRKCSVQRKTSIPLLAGGWNSFLLSVKKLCNNDCYCGYIGIQEGGSC
jgi:hypothetical protein